MQRTSARPSPAPTPPPLPRRRGRPNPAWAVALGALVAGCGAEAATPGDAAPPAATPPAKVDPWPEPVPLRLAGDASLAPLFEEAEFPHPEAEVARLGGALEFLVGTPGAPAYWPLARWREEGRDPSYGQDELGEGDWERIRADNQKRYGVAVAYVDAGAYGEASEPRGAAALWARWQREFAPLVAGEARGDALHPDSPTREDATDDDPAFTWHEEAQRFWKERYPSLAESAALYAELCQSCHGDSGAGDGAAGAFLEPRPRDLRAGVFKWTGATTSGRPQRAELARVLEEGVPGTEMLAFTTLTAAEREGLVDWVRWLAVRGETERVAAQLAAGAGALEPEHFVRAYELTWARWDAAAEEAPFAPTAPGDLGDAARAARGKELFRSELAACATCHGEEARGDGPAVWEEGPEGRRRRLDSWGNPSHPRDLVAQALRGGRAPEDVYRVVRQGIPGTIMPAAAATLSDTDAWDLVAYVLSIHSPLPPQAGRPQ